SVAERTNDGSSWARKRNSCRDDRLPSFPRRRTISSNRFVECDAEHLSEILTSGDGPGAGLSFDSCPTSQGCSTPSAAAIRVPPTNCCRLFTRSCVHWQREDWPRRSPGKHCKRLRWCTRHTCALSATTLRPPSAHPLGLGSRAGTAAATSSPLPPKPC